MSDNMDFKFIRKSGEIAASAMKRVLENVNEGTTLEALDRIAEEEIKRLGGESAFKMVPGYKYTTCLSLNAEIVHGIPRNIKLKNGDLLTVDLGANYKGWNTDTAWSVIVGGEPTHFLKVGEEAMWAGIDKAREGNRVGDVSEAIQTVVEYDNNFAVSRTLIGHGVGRKLHQDPEIPGFGLRNTGPVLKKGQTLAIEAIYTEVPTQTKIAEDGWTVVGVKGCLAGMFEMTVIVGKDDPEVITDWRKVS